MCRPSSSALQPPYTNSGLSYKIRVEAGVCYWMIVGNDGP